MVEFDIVSLFNLSLNSQPLDKLPSCTHCVPLDKDDTVREIPKLV